MPQFWALPTNDPDPDRADMAMSMAINRAMFVKTFGAYDRQLYIACL